MTFFLRDADSGRDQGKLDCKGKMGRGYRGFRWVWGNRGRVGSPLPPLSARACDWSRRLAPGRRRFARHRPSLPAGWAPRASERSEEKRRPGNSVHLCAPPSCALARHGANSQLLGLSLGPTEIREATSRSQDEFPQGGWREQPVPEGTAHHHRAVLRGPGGVGQVLGHLSRR